MLYRVDTYKWMTEIRESNIVNLDSDQHRELYERILIAKGIKVIGITPLP